MATAVRLESANDTTQLPLIVRGALVLGVVQAVAVIIVSMINKQLTGTADHLLTGIVVALGAGFTMFYPGLKTRALTIEGIAGAAGIGLGATWVFLVIDAFVLQLTLHVYTNRWHEIGGGSTWWYLPVWWMVGTYLSWMGGWILANQMRKSGQPSLVGAVLLVAILTALCGAVAVLTHFPGAGWNVGTFAVASMPALALATIVSSLGGARA